jgi:LacI family transcriptional regulator
MGRLKIPPQQRVTIKDIAAMAKVSIGTVDRVLHNRGEVNRETHDRVMSFVKELGYTPNLLAKSLALNKRFTISVLIPDAGQNNHYWKKPLEGFRMASDELSDFSTKIEIYYYDPGLEKSFAKEFNRLISARPDGIIMAPNFQDAAMQLIPRCNDLNIPFMFIDNNIDGQGLAYFGQDAFQSGIVAARLMHYGLHESSTVMILNLAGNKAITRHMQRREQGFISYFSNERPANGIKILSRAIDISEPNEPAGALKMLLSGHPQTAGIFVTNSRVHRVAEYLSSAGKGSLVIIGYDLLDANIEFMEKGIIDYLICQKPEDQGYRSAMAMFDFLLTGKHAGQINYSPIDIIVRENVEYYKISNH